MSVPDPPSACTLPIDRRRPDHPPTSPCCSARSWWNGWRRVCVTVHAEQTPERCERHLARAKCCLCHVSFTCYPPGHYPRRQYQLDVVTEVVAAVAISEGSGVQVARAVGASATSVRRWFRWVGALIEPSVALACAVQLDPDSLAGAGLSTLATSARAVGATVARVLGALEHFAAALLHRGIQVGACTGLGRVLEWQHRYHGVYVALVAEPRRLSPPMVLGLGARPV